MLHYDFVIAGGGLAGLSLALHLVQSPLRQRSILIIDKETKTQNDRTWAYWTDRSFLFDPIVYRSWDRLQVVGPGGAQRVDLRDYRYQMLRGSDFYRFARGRLSALGNVTFRQGVVSRIEDGPQAARVTVDGETVSGTWVFDSRFRRTLPQTDPARYHYLKLHFKGWEIETSRPAFDPQVATLLDFRTPQAGATRFFYVLPFSERRALVEYTLFSPTPLRRAEYEGAIRSYLETTRGLTDCRVLRQEGGVIPITDQPFPRRIGQRVMTIGATGGRIKPSTGYAFTRVQDDSAAIVRSLLRTGHPFDIPADPRRYRLYDALLLHIMCHHGDQLAAIFTTLFRNNPVARVLRFLDQVASPWENLALIATMPPGLFLRALFEEITQRRRGTERRREIQMKESTL